MQFSIALDRQASGKPLHLASRLPLRMPRHDCQIAACATPDSATLALLADHYFYDNRTETLIIAGMDASFRLLWIDAICQQAQHVYLAAADMGRMLDWPNTHYAFLAHNHPSGIAMASASDIEFTRLFSRQLRLRGQILLDHIICGGGHWGSMRMQGHL
jgi:DNA repair protein RadC